MDPEIIRTFTTTSSSVTYSNESGCSNVSACCVFLIIINFEKNIRIVSYWDSVPTLLWDIHHTFLPYHPHLKGIYLNLFKNKNSNKEKKQLI